MPLNCFLHAYDLVSELAEMVGQHGLWVCGGDHFLAVDKTALNLSLENQDMIAFTIPVLKEYSVNHGVYILSQEVLQSTI